MLVLESWMVSAMVAIVEGEYIYLSRNTEDILDIE